MVIVQCIDYKEDAEGKLTHAMLKDKFNNVRVLSSADLKHLIENNALEVSNMRVHNGKLIIHTSESNQ